MDPYAKPNERKVGANRPKISPLPIKWIATLAGLFFLASIAFTKERETAVGDRVVVAIRYLQIRGVSHANLHLFTADGGHLRQLTNQQMGQDHDPVFSPDGKKIVFQREIGTRNEIWSVDVTNGRALRLPALPDWYDTSGKDLLHFDTRSSAPGPYNPSAFEPVPTGSVGPLRYTAPDGSAELTLIHATDSSEEQDWEKRGSLFRVRDLRGGGEIILGSLPGFEGLWDPLHLKQGRVRGDNAPFLIEPPLQVVFFYKHQNSTDGDAVYVLDLQQKRIVRLSANWAMPIPIPGEPAFVTVTEERYRPLGDAKRTANCTYFDRWDASLNKTRFGRDVPAQFYGAAMRREGKAPLTIRWKLQE